MGVGCFKNTTGKGWPWYWAADFGRRVLFDFAARAWPAALIAPDRRSDRKASSTAMSADPRRDWDDVR